VVGDVSAKDLGAAMLGTLIVGATRALAQENLSPTVMLNRLHRHLHGRTDGSFATRLCALLAPDGAMCIANAGHLPPYRNDRELSCEHSLPLSILPATDYTETCVRLDPSDALTFMSKVWSRPAVPRESSSDSTAPAISAHIRPSRSQMPQSVSARRMTLLC
jgi:serine phosphatase RsbU (regulator of sigma subunit)